MCFMLLLHNKNDSSLCELESVVAPLQYCLFKTPHLLIEIQSPKHFVYIEEPDDVFFILPYYYQTQSCVLFLFLLCSLCDYYCYVVVDSSQHYCFWHFYHVLNLLTTPPISSFELWITIKLWSYSKTFCLLSEFAITFANW